MQDAMSLDDEADTRPSPRRAFADPHGQAALFLAESILHALVEDRTFSLARAIGVVQTASEVTADVGAETEGGKGRTQQSLNLLSAIEQSLAAGGIDADRTGKVVVLKR